MVPGLTGWLHTNVRHHDQVNTGGTYKPESKPPFLLVQGWKNDCDWVTEWFFGLKWYLTNSPGLASYIID